MQNILLLGAGFSKNWGAPIASEFFNALIADDEVRRTPLIHDLLWDNRWNFEKALARLQENDRRDTRANRGPLLQFQGAMGRVFGRMTTIFKRQDFEVTQAGLYRDRNRMVVDFLAKFDAIFTLNQDLLLEIHYFDPRAFESTNRRWAGACLPGMGAEGQPAEPAAIWSGRIWRPNNDFAVQNGMQPYFKLHGSVNWKGHGSDAELMIMGGGKEEAIQASPVLAEYHRIFSEYMHRAQTRLTIIGYGFGDTHINLALKDAVENCGLNMYVLDPKGAGIAYEARGDRDGLIKGPKTDFEVWFQKGLYSASTIPLRSLLTGESVDREVLTDFLAGS